MRRPGRRTSSIGAVAIALIATASASIDGAAAPSALGQAFVRVNQVGYATGSTTKRAYLMASASEAGATFSVKDSSGASVYSAPIGLDLGKWSSRYPNVYALDFPSVTAAGTYTISVTGAIPATSPRFRIAARTGLYRGALTNALAFYQVERDGPNFIPSALRNAAGHLNDQDAMTYLTPNANSSGAFKGDLSPLGVRIDASGGWWDAGDYLKFVQTTSYTVDLLLIGIRDLSAQMGSSSRSDFTAEGKFGADWLLRMWDDPTRTLYYQVGIGEGNANIVGDHDIWRLPQADDTFGGCTPAYRYICDRPVFRAGPPGSPISPNLAGRDAAALAEAYQVFKTADPAFAGRCLVAAEHIFDLADTNPSGDLLTVIPFGFYPETEWRDDLELGATELYRTLAEGSLPAGLPHTDPMYYLTRAAHWANAYINGPNDAADTLNLYDVSGLAHFELDRSIAQAGNPAGLKVTPAQLVADLKKQLDGAVAQGASEPFGFGFPWATWDTTSHGAGLAVMSSEYDQLTGTHDFAAYGERWLGNILGANAWGSSFVVGDGSTFPHCLQHQVANLAGHLDGTPPILKGAAVEGPNGTATKGLVSGMNLCPADGVDVFAQFNGHHAEWKDDMQSFSNTEPAIDLTASSPLAFARQAAGLT